MTTMTPRECARLSEATAELPPGTTERFSGYALMGMPFGSGHYLAYRRFPASSIGPGYHAAWLRRPDGRWTVYADAPPELSCSRYFGAAFSEAVYAPVAGHWSGPFQLTVTVPGVLSWRLELESTPATAALTAMARKMPAAVWRNDGMLGAMGLMMGPALRSGKMKLSGLVPNGQSFRAHPQRVWMVGSAEATIDGEDAGVPQSLPVQEHLADFWLPQRGIFVADLGIDYPSTASEFRSAPARNGSGS
ncbi:hypothetical protein ACIPVK_20570 [Paeniglutamicibacter sp. MACA_103]|uniref:hypothetical protein n=1 Tax=Paeniglutamicibacter sp. MACA_103 TaxID=3377337 RepID=UPI0038965846